MQVSDPLANQVLQVGNSGPSVLVTSGLDKAVVSCRLARISGPACKFTHAATGISREPVFVLAASAFCADRSATSVEGLGATAIRATALPALMTPQTVMALPRHRRLVQHPEPRPHDGPAEYRCPRSDRSLEAARPTVADGCSSTATRRAQSKRGRRFTLATVTGPRVVVQ